MRPDRCPSTLRGSSRAYDMGSAVPEDYHASIEASFIPALECALSGDVGFYADDRQCIPFLNYLCPQYMRNPRHQGARPREEPIPGTDLEHRHTHVGDKHRRQPLR